MSHRRKRSKGDRINPVKGAMIINKGGGGGQKVRGTSLEASQQRTADMKASRHLIAGNKVEERERSERLSLRSLRAKSGMQFGKVEVVLRKSPAPSGEAYASVMAAIREERG